MKIHLFCVVVKLRFGRFTTSIDFIRPLRLLLSRLQYAYTNLLSNSHLPCFHFHCSFEPCSTSVSSSQTSNHHTKEMDSSAIELHTHEATVDLHGSQQHDLHQHTSKLLYSMTAEDVQDRSDALTRVLRWLTTSTNDETLKAPLFATTIQQDDLLDILFQCVGNFSEGLSQVLALQCLMKLLAPLGDWSNISVVQDDRFVPALLCILRTSPQEEHVYSLTLSCFERFGCNKQTAAEMFRHVDVDELCALLLHPGFLLIQKRCLAALLYWRCEHHDLKLQGFEIVAVLVQILVNPNDTETSTFVCKSMFLLMDKHDEANYVEQLIDQCVFSHLTTLMLLSGEGAPYALWVAARLAQSSIAPPEYLHVMLTSVVTHWIHHRGDRERDDRRLVEYMVQWIEKRPSLLQVCMHIYICVCVYS